MKYFVFVTILIFAACQTPKTEKKPAPVPETTFQKSLMKHGGLDRWNSFNTLEFDRLSDEDTVHHVIDLRSRKEVFYKGDDYTVCFGDSSYWISPNKEAFGKDEPRFYKNLWFYFFSLPFVAGDPGVNQVDLPSRELNNRKYNGVGLTFGENIGDSPDDQYRLWTNPETNQLEWINYSVTYWNKENSSKFNAIVFNQWQDVDGLLVPKEMTGHRYQADTIGESRYHFIFKNVKFSTEPPNAALFQMPEGVFSEKY